MSGASTRQQLWKVRFPMALPAIAVGFNRTMVLSLFILILAAFLGTLDLGKEMQKALWSTDVGKGLELGLCVAFTGLMADHLIFRWSDSRKKALGLE